MRVSFITHAMDDPTLTPKAIQTVVGHSTLSQTVDVYARPVDGRVRQVVESMPFGRPSRGMDVLSIDGRAIS